MNGVFPLFEGIAAPEFVAGVLSECELNDPAHSPLHVAAVVREADRLCKSQANYRPWRKLVLLGALLHDVKCHAGRAEHHVAGAKAVPEYMAKTGFDYTPEEVEIVAQAVLKHRASFAGERTHPVEHALAMADRGRPNPINYLERSVDYTLAECRGLGYIDRPWILSRVVSHMYDKYSAKGYAWNNLSPEYAEVYAEELADTHEYFQNSSQTMMHAERYLQFLLEPDHEFSVTTNLRNLSIFSYHELWFIQFSLRAALKRGVTIYPKGLTPEKALEKVNQDWQDVRTAHNSFRPFKLFSRARASDEFMMLEVYRTLGSNFYPAYDPENPLVTGGILVTLEHGKLVLVD